MKNTLNSIAFWKVFDLWIQLLAFIVMLLLYFLTKMGPFAFFVEAGVQVISCLLWSLSFDWDTPKYRNGVLIRRIFGVVLITWVLSILIPFAGIIMLYVMLFAGPALGLSYFIITAQEAAYYRKARKPYYLL